MRSVEVHFENTVNDYPERLFGILVEPAMQIIDGFRHRIIRSALNTHESISNKEHSPEDVKNSEWFTIAVILLATQQNSARFWIDWKEGGCNFKELITEKYLKQARELSPKGSTLGAAEIVRGGE